MSRRVDRKPSIISAAKWLLASGIFVFASFPRAQYIAATTRNSITHADSQRAGLRNNGRGAIGVFCQLRPDGACVVQQVTKGGPAESAGLRAGDILLRPDPADQATMVEQLAKHAIGTQLTLPFERHGERKQAVVTIGDQLSIALRGAELGDASAENTIGGIYLNGLGVQKDYAEALKWYRESAAKQFPAAEIRLGELYENGLGVSKDMEAALDWYRQAAGQGSALAEWIVGNAYFGGIGVPKDQEAAFAWYSAAAKQGSADAEAQIGYMYLNGFGAAKDPTAALEWYRKAAVQGELAAYFGLGDMYANGVGVPNDHVAAAQWYRKAAEQGYAAAEYDLGMMYAIGDGVPKDTKAAIDWLNKAAEHGDPRAKPTLEKMQQ
ncbi:MAG: PDZ domain-containing protein [Candidatus Acidiferrum sp.]